MARSVLAAAVLAWALAWGGPAEAQQGPWRGSPASPPDAGGVPTARPPMAPGPASQPLAQAPFPPLTPTQQTFVDRWLAAWEARSTAIQQFETEFTLYEYDPVFGPADKPRFTELGVLKYKAPDKGYFRVDGERPELWICDGRSIYEFNHQDRVRREFPLPPEMQGQAIRNGPLPFLFGAKADELKSRFWIRGVAPPDDKRDTEVWLEAYPRWQRDAADYRRADLVLDAKTVLPKAIQLHLPDNVPPLAWSRQRKVYSFEAKTMRVNPSALLAVFQRDPFDADAQTPHGWKKLVEKAATAEQLGAEPPGPRR